MMALRPQTLYGLTDSPVFLAAFMLDHDPASLEMITRAFDGQQEGQQEGLTRDDVLDNITLFWLTRGVPDASLGRPCSPHVNMPALDGVTEWLNSELAPPSYAAT